jgi:hypothetical protein
MRELLEKPATDKRQALFIKLWMDRQPELTKEQIDYFTDEKITRWLDRGS